MRRGGGSSGGRRSPRSPRRGGSGRDSPRVDARKLPRYPLDFQTAPVEMNTRTVPTRDHPDSVHQIPRRADSEFVTVDRGSCATHFIRVTTNNFPANKDDVVCLRFVLPDLQVLGCFAPSSDDMQLLAYACITLYCT